MMRLSVDNSSSSKKRVFSSYITNDSSLFKEPSNKKVTQYQMNSIKSMGTPEKSRNDQQSFSNKKALSSLKYRSYFIQENPEVNEISSFYTLNSIPRLNSTSQDQSQSFIPHFQSNSVAEHNMICISEIKLKQASQLLSDDAIHYQQRYTTLNPNEFLLNIFDKDEPDTDFILEQVLFLYFDMKVSNLSLFNVEVTRQVDEDYKIYLKQIKKDFLFEIRLSILFLLIKCHDKSLEILRNLKKNSKDYDLEGNQYCLLDLWLGWTLIFAAKNQNFLFQSQYVEQAKIHLKKSKNVSHDFSLIRNIGLILIDIDYIYNSKLDRIIQPILDATKVQPEHSEAWNSIMTYLILKINDSSLNQKYYSELKESLKKFQKYFLVEFFLLQKFPQYQQDQTKEWNIIHSIILQKQDLMNQNDLEIFYIHMLKFQKKSRNLIGYLKILRKIQYTFQDRQLIYQRLYFLYFAQNNNKKLNFGLEIDTLDQLIKCYKFLDKNNIFQYQIFFKVTRKLYKIYYNFGFLIRAIQIFNDLYKLEQLSINLTNEDQNFQFLKNKINQSFEKYTSFTQDANKRSTEIKQMIDFTNKCHKNQNQNTYAKHFKFLNFFNNDERFDAIKQIEDKNKDLYELLLACYKRYENPKIKYLKILEDNTYKFEFWYLTWYLIHNKIIQTKDFSEQEFVHQFFKNLDLILISRNYYTRINSKQIFYFLGKKYQKFSYISLLNYIKIKCFSETDIKQAYNFLLTQRLYFKTSDIYLYQALKILIKTQKDSQNIIHEDLNEEIQFFYQENLLQNNQYDKYKSLIWGKIFFLMFYICHRDNDESEKINYFRELSIQIFQSHDKQDYFQKLKKKY